MKRSYTIVLCLVLFSFALAVSMPQTPGVGPPLRVDFQGTHEMEPTAPEKGGRKEVLVTGTPSRIDFEGTHEMEPSSTSKKAPTKGGVMTGAPIRIDFEGTHPPA